ncbi:MAG: calcium/proton exchanger [Gemmataceae bacterium]|nr:calcium/proton exchanger [Gemmataceae bacterium]
MEPLYWLLLAVPVAVGLRITHYWELGLFLVSAVAIIPLAGLMGRATENLAETMGAGIGGLLNATFGNAAELIIALIALISAATLDPTIPEEAARSQRMLGLVKASITGSIIGNILLVLGLAILFGGVYHKRQLFNATAASMGATLLALASAGLLMPTIYYHIYPASHPTAAERQTIVHLSEEIALILFVLYALNLVFSLRTHQHLFAGPEDQVPTTGEHRQPEWSRRTSLLVLLGATAGVAVVSEFLVGSVEHAGKALGMNEVFIGVIVVATVGNAAEHSTAVLVALKNKMDLAVTIAVGSSIQIALFVAPVLVFISLLLGGPTLDLHFSTMEIVAVLTAVGVLALVSQDGESHWMEGAMLLGVYVIIGLAFYNLPRSALAP